MPLTVDDQLLEHMEHDADVFPLTYFEHEFSFLPDREISLHWHPEFELISSVSHCLDIQVGQEHLTLAPSESILINGNVMHAMRQISGETPDPMPNIVFSGSLVAPETSAVYQRYLFPIASCGSLPFILFQDQTGWHRHVNRLADAIYAQLRERGQCYEMVVQRSLNEIFEHIFRHFDRLPKVESNRVQLKSQIRLQQMLLYIHKHYHESITLNDIARAANISRSEANRCFRTYMNCSPVEALISYRLKTACGMLGDSSLTLLEISEACGFHSENYFCKSFKKAYGHSPGQRRHLGK